MQLAEAIARDAAGACATHASAEYEDVMALSKPDTRAMLAAVKADRELLSEVPTRTHGL